MQTIYASHAAIPPFRLLRPERAEEASAARADLGPEALFLAGGVDLVPAMRAGRRAEVLVSLHGIRALATIERKETALRIGAGLTYAGLAADADVRAAMPDFAAVFAGVANIRVRHAATLGGNLMARNPAYDLLPALLALDAKLVFIDRHGRREIISAAEATFPDGLLAEIDIPPSAERRFAFERGYKPALSLAVAIERRGRRFVGRAAVGCAYAHPLALTLDLGSAPDRAAIADRADAVAGDFAARMRAPLDDAAASAEYRRTLTRVLLARALRALAKR
jgi:aerobic carbon-monoxide dehydrogenase medium subunit